MRLASILSIVIVALSAPAFAEDADLRKQVDQISSAFAESFDKQDAAGLAALFATDYIIVNQFGPRKDVAQLVEGTRKAGFDHEEISVDQVWPLGSDTALGTGQVRFTGKNQSGASIEAAAFWTATYVREGGKWKVRMLTASPKPPPPAK
jgi:ketosteroid isomerase-like protein